jgi:hypothetical protein
MRFFADFLFVFALGVPAGLALPAGKRNAPPTTAFFFF